MAVILNIETSSKACSVALTAEGMVLCHFEEFAGQNHAAVLSDFIKRCLDHLAEHEKKLEAVAVSIGPGSYTGLRIGLSEAKGLAYALDIPLIGVSTLEIMAVNVMFNHDPDFDSLLMPMMDARRMEVFTAIYDFSLVAVCPPAPLIFDEEKPLAGILDMRATEGVDETDRPVADFNSESEEQTNLTAKIENATEVCYFGDGSDKVELLLRGTKFRHIKDVVPLAVDMLALSEKAYRDRKFLDLAYSTPQYLKAFQASKPKSLI